MAVDESRVEEIFFSALDRGTEQERAAYLDEVCKGDDSLRSRVQKLLDASPKLGSFLQRDAGDIVATTDQPITEKPGAQIGPYKIREQIGEGGFGAVFVAEQTKPVRRNVALKVIKPGMDTKEVIARFEAERQALALMDHPNVAKVLDAGTTDSGRPYFVMELVQGVPITEFCDQQRLSTKERLQLFVDVCQAVQHAHQKGVIHRDIKPSNVMVTMYDHRPVVKVIDFGVAKAIGTQLTEKTIYTAYGQMVGTPMYMSPEQAQLSGLDVDTRSDVYSLGVLVYELLTGVTPFDKETLQKAGFDEMRRIILEEEPRSPSVHVSTLLAEQLSTVSDQRKIDAGRLSQLLKGELDWIVMKGLEKDRSRRYETAASLADDVDRYLNDEAVQACPPTMAYRLGKFVQRNKAAFGVAAAMVVLLLVGIVATTWQAVRATSEKNRAVAAEDLAERRLQESEAARAQSDKDRQTAFDAQKKAEAALSESKAISEFLTDLLKKPRPGEEGGGRDVKLVDLLDDAVQRLDQSKTISPDRIAELRGKIAATYHALSSYEEAIELRESTLDHFQQTWGEGHPATIAPMVNLANSYRSTGRTTEAAHVLEDAVALSLKHFGREHKTTVLAMASLADSHESAGRSDEALMIREDVLELSRRVFGTDHVETHRAMNNLAISFFRAGRFDEALELREETFAKRQQTLGNEHPETIIAMMNLANSLETSDRLDDALKMREGVLGLSRKVFGPDHLETSRALHNLANSLALAGRLDEALELREEILAQRQRKLGSEHPETLRAMDSLAGCHHKAGEVEEAADLREEILPLSRKVHGPGAPFTQLMMNNLAVSCHLAGRLERELEVRAELLAVRNRTLGPDHPKTLYATRILASRYQEAGRHDEARVLREEQKRLRQASDQYPDGPSEKVDR